MNNFFLYARKSTDEADRQVPSIEAQLHELGELASKEGFKISDTFIESQTAKEPGRPVFNSMISRIEKGEAQGILTWHPDRLARNSVDGGRIIYLIDIGKLLWLKFPTFWFEPTPQGKFMLNIAFGQSKYMIDNLAENVKRGMRAKVRRGVWPTLAPFGYRNDTINKTVIPDPETAHFVKKLFQLYAEGQHTIERLGVIANKLGFYSRNRRGTKIHTSRIHAILRNPFYYGLVRWKGEDHEGVHEPLITRKLFNQVQQVIAHGKPTGFKGGAPRDFAFRGLFHCGECGCMITAEKHKGHTYYRCTRKHGLCFQRYLREEDLSSQVQAELNQLALSDTEAQSILDYAENEKVQSALSYERSAKALKEKSQELDARLERLLDLYLKGEVEKEEYHAKRSELVGLKIDLKTQLEGLERTGTSLRLEPLIEFINWSKALNKPTNSYDVCARRQRLLRKQVRTFKFWGKKFCSPSSRPPPLLPRDTLLEIGVGFRTMLEHFSFPLPISLIYPVFL